MKTTMTALLVAVPVALSVAMAATPTASADPAFDVPVDVLPNIVVPPQIGQYAAPLGAGIRDLILGNPGTVQGGAQILSAVSCAVAGLFGNPCE